MEEDGRVFERRMEERLRGGWRRMEEDGGMFERRMEEDGGGWRSV